MVKHIANFLDVLKLNRCIEREIKNKKLGQKIYPCEVVWFMDTQSSSTMASQKWGQKDSGQYSVYNQPTSNLDLMRTRGEKYETHLHLMGQRWGDKVR